MSISLHRNQASASSSSSCSQSQSSASEYGYEFDPQSQQFLEKDLRISDSPSTQEAKQLPGELVSAARFSGGSSKQVKGRKIENHGSSLHGDTTLNPYYVTRVKDGSSELQEQPAGRYFSPKSRHVTGCVSSSSQTGSGHLTGRKVQMVSGNHLLNFHYDPIPVSNRQPRQPPRMKQKRKPYNKDLFFQANYKFVVLDSGNYAIDSMEPDKILSWEDVICLKYSTPFPVQCPICLDEPLCPQITSCGHIFCFPCILQYFSIDGDDLKDECWKKCPLCFTMISSKDLNTIRVEKVKQFHIGDEIEFVLLTRQKGSYISSLRNQGNTDIVDEITVPFSKFTYTSDVNLSVREAISDLDSWMARANSGLVDDYEKLPYVCAAFKQLEKRKIYWAKRCSLKGDTENLDSYGSPPTPNASVNLIAYELARGTISTPLSSKSDRLGRSSRGRDQVVGDFCLPPIGGLDYMSEYQDKSSSSSFEDNKSLQLHSTVVNERTDASSYNFYQAVDGQHIILHPLNMKCLLHHYGSDDRLPNSITGKILELEAVTQSEAMRRRYRFLSHLSLTTTFQLCEIDLADVLPAESLSPFMDEIKNREKQRQRVARKELKEKIKAEVAASQFVPGMFYSSYDTSPSFSMDDFEALGSAAEASSRPSTIGEGHSFSAVARLGFAAAHDSPALRIDESETPPENGFKNAGTSFASIISRAKPEQVLHKPKATEVGKKGKKQTRVLLSTAGGRRY